VSLLCVTCSTATASLVLVATPQMYNPADTSGGIQAAIKNMTSNTVFYFSIPISLEVVFAPGATMDLQALVTAWKAVEESLEVSALVNDLPTVDIEAIKAKLAANDVSFVAKRDVPGQEGQQVAVYFCARTVTNTSLLIELKFKTGMNLCKATVRSTNKGLSELCKTAVSKLLLA
jgi:hypothetical protein